MGLEDYVTVAQAAEMLGKTVDLVGKLCRAGRLPGAEKMGGAGWLIPRAAVENYAPDKRGPKTKKEKLAAELEGIRAAVAETAKGE